MDLYALPDGRVIVIRPIRPDDQERLRASHSRLSPLTRYRRFMTSKPYLSAADAAYLAEIDGRSHYALVATFAPPGGEAIPEPPPPFVCADLGALAPALITALAP